MRVGLTLPVDYLIGTNAGDGAKAFAGAFGNPERCLSELRAHGVGSIELQGVGPKSRAADLLDAARCVIGSGMALTVHGYLPGDTQRSLFEDADAPLLPAMEFLKTAGKDTVMVVHAHADPAVDWSALTASSAQALERLAGDIGRYDLPIAVALEINRYHGVDTPGATYDGLLEIAERAEAWKPGFCWDLGHTLSSAMQHKLPATPPDDFIAKVIHTHIHGVLPDGETHQPLTGPVPGHDDGLRRLASAGYAGICNLELYPWRWASEDKVRAGVLGSVTCLRELLARVRSAAAPGFRRAP